MSRRAVSASLLALAAGSALGRAPKAFDEKLVVLRTADGRSCSVTGWVTHLPRGTILFSHGALSSPWKYRALIAPWVTAGFDVWAPLHVDSSEHPQTSDYPGLASWPARILDLRALADHVDARHYVAVGHSYGALAALTLGGASSTRPDGVIGPLRDMRARSVMAFSPPGPGMGLIDRQGYATLAVPALIETGTLDIPPGAMAPDGWQQHLTAYTAPAAGGARYALVLDGADHYFGNIICRPERPAAPQRTAFDSAVEMSRLFLRAFACNDRRARASLDEQSIAGAGVGLHRR